MPVITVDTPADLLPGDELQLEVPDGELAQYAPPLDHVDATSDIPGMALVHLGEGQPGPFYYPADQPVTVRRGG